MFVYVGLRPTASLDIEMMVTSVLTSPPPAPQKQMIQGLVSSGLYETLQSLAPRGRNAALDNSVGTLVFALIVNVKDGRAANLRPCLGGAAPGAGDSHFVSPSD